MGGGIDHLNFLEVDKDTVNRVILRAGEHCAHVPFDLLTSLDMTEVQLDELWTFAKKKRRPALIESQIRHLCCLLQFDPAPRKAHPWCRSDLPT
jgi:hypothetical protein